jgi:hypothetical protein
MDANSLDGDRALRILAGQPRCKETGTEGENSGEAGSAGGEQALSARGYSDCGQPLPHRKIRTLHVQ